MEARIGQGGGGRAAAGAAGTPVTAACGPPKNKNAPRENVLISQKFGAVPPEILFLPKIYRAERAAPRKKKEFEATFVSLFGGFHIILCAVCLFLDLSGVLQYHSEAKLLGVRNGEVVV